MVGYGGIRQGLVRSGAWLLLTTVLWAGVAAAQQGPELAQLTLTEFGEVDGLPNGGVTALAQTPDGYLWIGTRNGLARFDGHRFVVFDRDVTVAMADADITALIADRDGALWIGTRQGLLVSRGGRIARVDSIAALRGAYVRSLFEDTDGAIWVGLYGEGLLRLGGGGVEVESFGVAEGLSDGFVRAILRTRSGDLWVATSSGLARLREGGFETFTEADGLGSNFIRALAEDAGGRLWVGTEGGGLARWAEGGFETVATEPPVRSVNALRVDRAGHLWVASGTSGVLRMSDQRTEILTAAEGLSHDLVWSLLEDAEGSFWIGTRGGLTQVRSGGFQSLSVGYGLGNAMVRTVSADGGEVLVGSEGGGLDRWTGERFEPALEASRLPSPRVRSVHRDRQGALWVGTRDGLLRTLGGVDTRFDSTDGLGSDVVNVIAESADGELWVGTSGGGVVRWDGGGFEPGFPEAPAARSLVVRDLLPTPGGDLWIASEQGLYLGTPSGLRNVTAERGLDNSIVNSLHLGADGVLWFGIDGLGLARLHDDRLTLFGVEQGLDSDAIFRIIEDDLGSLWLCSASGISSVSLAALEAAAAAGGPAAAVAIERVAPHRGASTECSGGSQPAGAKLEDGRLWFPTLRGLVTIDPQRKVREMPRSALRIESVSTADGERIEPAQVTVPAADRQLSIRYSVPTFVAPQRLRFRHRLGADGPWVDAGDSRGVSYSGLRPGAHRFFVNAGIGSTWSEDVAELVVNVEPRWSELLWVRLLLVAGAVGLGWLLLLSRTRRLRERERRLAKLVAQKTAELADANRHLEQVAELDYLTQLTNRRGLRRALDREWRRALRSGEAVSGLMIDIDRFKDFNDSFGHSLGDRCLRRVAEVIGGAARRPNDVAARFGGEEFVLILPGVDVAGASKIAETIRRETGTVDVRRPDGSATRQVTVSIGVASVEPKAGAVVTDLLEAIDQALYRAKQDGRNCVRVR